jgi:hypothetical protein
VRIKLLGQSLPLPLRATIHSGDLNPNFLLSCFNSSDLLSDEAKEISRQEKYLFTLEEIKEELTFARTLIETHATEIVQTGKCSLNLSEYGWLANSLIPLYPNSKILSYSERQNLRKKDRNTLLKFKTKVIEVLINALNFRDSEKMWLALESVFSEFSPKGEKANAYLTLDRFYLGLGRNSDAWSTCSGGMTHIIELVWHIEREICFGTYSNLRSLFPSKAFIKKKGLNPSLANLCNIILENVASKARQESFKTNVLDDSFKYAYLEKWDEFLVRIHRLMGFIIPSLSFETIRGQKKAPLPFRTTSDLLESIETHGFTPSPSFQRVVFKGELLELTKTEGRIVKTLYEDKNLRERLLPDKWATEDDILELIKNSEGYIGSLRDILWTNGHKTPRESVKKKLILYRQVRNVWQFRLNI